ncbi:DNA repair protein RecN [Halobacteroides halobius DSM 5150]|uniref:DNA repair protein RecN n=1 Tax=Halobacteroides halobius (strain ATCC 35273 / DSM 5150 / MD-1) TaxID=748449 RepID=L0K7L5_HALHC|nr:DNA repair protein RecN [Halobacteroides halobius]AGB40540.1 DNA repair protein RecN [Halobacteroides halobius DSM 5150]
MLSNLIIKNFALIDKVDLEFASGLNILTGETGAGKSIIVNALEMLLGGRASTDFIREGEEKAIIEACFDISDNDNVVKKIKKLGIELSADQNLILTREISHKSNNKSRVNGRIVTLETIRQLSRYLINLHTQHEYQMLLSSTDQLKILDRLGEEKIVSLRKKVAAIYNKLQTKKKELTEISYNQKERERRVDLLRFQLQEIKEADLEVGEEKKLLTERKKLSNVEELNKTIEETYKQLYDSDYPQSALVDQLNQLVKDLEPLVQVDQELEKIINPLKEATYQLEDVAFQLEDYQAGIEFNSQRLAIVEDRLKQINDLKRKYGDNIEEIVAYYTEISQELSELKNNKQKKKKLKNKIKELKKEYLNLATELSQLRKKVANNLTEEILKQLSNLAITKAKFKVEFERREEFSSQGIDKVNFLFAPNPGSQLKPVADIASGGELSRVMLVLKSIMAQTDQLSSLVFDEIDTGIGGRVAKLVANKLVSLAKDYQLLCVTHLPQIACKADSHYLITKQVEHGKTYTKINKLLKEEKIKELARMLDGSLDQTTLEHAAELLQGA